MSATAPGPDQPKLAEDTLAGISRRLCAEVAAWRYDDLPDAVVRTVKLFLVDTFGVIGGAAAAPGIRELNGRLARWEQGGAATGLIGKRRFSPPTAALANGAAAHALDFDDMHDPARVHAFCVALPTLLATAEDVGAVSGADFILGLAIAVELHARLGLACYNSLGKGWHPTMILGTPAAALGAGRLLGLGAAAMLNAFGMALHMSAGSAQSMLDGVLSKRLGPGFAARSAVTAAFLALDGLTGPFQPLEGAAGLFRLHERGEVRPGEVLDGLGTGWRLLDYSIKPYPCCRCNHTTIGLALRLHARGIRPDDVAAATIRLGRVNWQTVGQPYAAARDSVVHAQFNVCYSFARALSDGRLDLASYQRPQITDAAVARLAGRVRAVVDQQVPATAMAPAHVAVTLTDGSVVAVAADTVKGSHAEPLTEAEIFDKFRRCLAFGLGTPAAAADRFADTLLALETLPDMRLLAPAFPEPAA